MSEREQPCDHVRRADGLCPTCGHCMHDVILNGACMACSSTELGVRTEKPLQSSRNVVPAGNLTRHRGGDS